MKKLLYMFMILVWLMSATCGSANTAGAVPARESEALPAIDVADGEGQSVATLSTLGISSDRPGHAVIAFSLENRGERALTQLAFTLLCLDCEGVVISNKPTTNREFFMHDPVQPGETRRFEVDRYFTGAENTVWVTVEDGLAKDEAELPAWTEPRPHNLLLDFCNDPAFSAHFENLDANPPVKMDYHVDEAVDETVTDLSEMLAAIEGLRSMRVGGESNECVTDSGISYWFTMADGSEWGLSFEAPGLLHWHGKIYETERQ